MNTQGITKPETFDWLIALANAELRLYNKGFIGGPHPFGKLNALKTAKRHLVNGTKPRPVYEADYEYRIDGIPCGIVVTYYSGPEFNNWGHPDNREPDQPADVEFFVVDRDGYSAEWLERKADYEEMRRDVLEMCRGK